MQSRDPADLLEAEHAVARVLAQGAALPRVYPLLLEAIGAALDWDLAAAWEIEPDGAMACVETWAAPGVEAAAFTQATRELRFARGEGLPGRAWRSGRAVRVGDIAGDASFPRSGPAGSAGLHGAVCFPTRGGRVVIGAIELFSRAPMRADGSLLQTLESLGRQIGQAIERARAEGALRDSIARKTAIFDAAFDCIISMDAEGRVVEVNAATERTFGYRAEAMVGRDLADLIVPEHLREAHRRGVRRYLETGHGRMLDHPLELDGQRADGSLFPVEVAITQPELDGPPLFTGFVRDVTDRRRADEALRALAAEQAALRRVATLVASEGDPREVFSAVTEEVGRLLGAQSANMVRYEDGDEASVVGGWSAHGTPAVPVGGRVALRGDTATVVVRRTGRPARIESYDSVPGPLAEQLRALGFRCAVAAPITLGGRLWGAVVVSSVRAGAFAPGDENRISDFAELVAQALANAQARELLAASRRRIVQAGDEARQRLERNLHDGAQQRLVALALTVRMAERKLADDADTAGRLLAQAGTELEQALAELREIARGLHPAVLTERGLGPAVDALATRAPVPVDVGSDIDGRLPGPVEAAAYYVVSEALTNVAKYAGASAARVGITRDDGVLVVEVADDGVGGADASRGSGLRGLADRVEALGGRLDVSSPEGSGTTLRATLPCASA